MADKLIHPAFAGIADKDAAARLSVALTHNFKVEHRGPPGQAFPPEPAYFVAALVAYLKADQVRRQVMFMGDDRDQTAEDALKRLRGSFVSDYDNLVGGAQERARTLPPALLARLGGVALVGARESVIGVYYLTQTPRQGRKTPRLYGGFSIRRTVYDTAPSELQAAFITMFAEGSSSGMNAVDLEQMRQEMLRDADKVMPQASSINYGAGHMLVSQYMPTVSELEGMLPQQ